MHTFFLVLLLVFVGSLVSLVKCGNLSPLLALGIFFLGAVLTTVIAVAISLKDSTNANMHDERRV